MFSTIPRKKRPKLPEGFWIGPGEEESSLEKDPLRAPQ